MTNNGSWHRVEFTGEDQRVTFKLHFVHDSLLQTVIDEIMHRGADRHIIDDTRLIAHPALWHWDTGGWCREDRSIEKLTVRGLPIHVPSQDFECFLSYIEEVIASPSRPSLSAKVAWQKLHSRFTCLAIECTDLVRLRNAAMKIRVAARSRGEIDNEKMRKTALQLQADGVPMLYRGQVELIESLPPSGRGSEFKQ